MRYSVRDPKERTVEMDPPTFDCGWKGYSRAVGVRGTFGVCHCGWHSPIGSVSQNKADVAEHIESQFDAERQAIEDEYDREQSR